MAEDFDSAFELLPADGVDITSDEQLEAALGNIPDPGEDADALPLPLGRGWAFDFDKGQFARAGSSPAPVAGLDNLRMWVEKTLRTARFAHPVYSDEYGVDMPWELLGRSVSAEAIGSYSAAVTEALLIHDRISRVHEFTFTLEDDDDALQVGFTVVVDAGDALTFSPQPLGGS